MTKFYGFAPVVLTAAFAALSTSTASAVIVIDDGAVHNVPPDIGETVILRNNGALATTLNVGVGGTVAGNVRADDDSIVNISGGTIFDLDAHDNSVSTVTGGSIEEFNLFGNAVVNFSGGTLTIDVEMFNNSALVMTGGTINAAGSLRGILLSDNATASISGGTISNAIVIRESGMVTLSGLSFNFAAGDYAAGSALDGQVVTGTLADGSAFSQEVSFENSVNATLRLEVIPEPSSLALLGLGGLLVARRRR